MFQFDLTEFSILTPFLEFVIMALFLYLTIYFASRQIYGGVLIIYLFALIIGFRALIDFVLPFSPYLQIFYILLETYLFIKSMLEGFK